jgi:HSP20 family protein
MTDDNVTVCMAIPGANPDDISVNVTGDTLTVSGEVKHTWHSGRQQDSSDNAQSQTGKGSAGQESGQQRDANAKRSQPQTYIEEMWHGRFQRTFTLPTQVQADKASADFENGVLKVTLPKSEATKPRKVQVRQQQTIQGQSDGNNGGSQSGQEQNVPVGSGSSQ